MKRHRLAPFVAALAILFGIATYGVAAASPGPASGYIVVLADRVDVTVAVAEYRRNLAVRPLHTYRHALNGFSANLTSAQAAALRADPTVAFIQRDRVVQLEGHPLPTGVDRVEADLSPTAKIDGRDGLDERVDADVAIIDTGIQPDHPDLRVAGGVNCTDTAASAPTDWADGNGHGTHVAGIVSALDNDIGVVGVAPGARVWAVRVFRSDGYSLLSWIVCGIDWVTGRRAEFNDGGGDGDPGINIAVANMSLRDAGSDDGNCGDLNEDAEHLAICNSVNAGITYAVAAGNDRTDASNWVPAAYDEVITVSALADFDGTGGGGAPSTCSSFGSSDSDDTFADFSNFGADIDLIAPGKCIYSTYPTNKSTGTGYAVLSGTSLASPHVAGGAALYKAEHPAATPADVKAALQGAGTLDWFTNTDPDKTHERLLNVSSFGRLPDFSLSASPSSITLSRKGGTATYTVEVIRGNGFSGDVGFSVTGIPAGATASFSPLFAVGLGGLSSTLTVKVPRSSPNGTYLLTITGTAGGVSRTTSVSLVKR